MFTRHMYHKIKYTYKTKHDPAFPYKEEQTTEKLKILSTRVDSDTNSQLTLAVPSLCMRLSKKRGGVKKYTTI